jgi:hypothetical protein
LTVHDDGIAVDDDLEVAAEHEDRNMDCCWICDGMNRVGQALKLVAMASQLDTRIVRMRGASWEIQVNGGESVGGKGPKTHLARLSTDRSSPMVDGI